MSTRLRVLEGYLYPWRLQRLQAYAEYIGCDEHSHGYFDYITTHSRIETISATKEPENRAYDSLFLGVWVRLLL